MKQLLILITTCFCLLGCHNIHNMKEKNDNQLKQYKGSSSAVSQQQCFRKCEQIFKSCRSQCHDNCSQCQKIADNQAWKRYQAYCTRMKIQCSLRPRDWLSFRDPLQCRKVSCSCAADFNVCIQQCGGQIKKRLHVTPYCQ